MRVIGGSARGRRLVPITGREIRPTPDRVREALFSILYSRRGTLADCRVLDLFAGSGALGIEALSRGAAHAWFVDHGRDAVATVRNNLERCGFSDKGTVIMHEVLAALPNLTASGAFDVIFADPPYSRDHAAKLLETIDRYGLLRRGGLICLETAPGDPVPAKVGTLQLLDQRRYGSTMLHFFHLSSEDQG